MSTISVVMVVKDAEKTLAQSIQSTRFFADEIVVVDSASIDDTVQIAKGLGAKVFFQPLKSFGEQKQFALEQANCDWVFSIDSDEEVEEGLAREIKEIVSRPTPHSAFKVKRKNIYFGKWLQHGGKFPDEQVRLLQKNRCRFSNDLVHEKVLAQGSVGRLENALLHYSYPDTETWIRKLEMFSRFRAEELMVKGTTPGFSNFFLFCVYRPLWRFTRRFFFKLGFLDGYEGFLACVHDGLTEILGYVSFSQKQSNKKME